MVGSMNQQKARLEALNYLRAFNISKARERAEQMPDDDYRKFLLSFLEEQEVKLLEEIRLPCLQQP